MAYRRPITGRSENKPMNAMDGNKCDIGVMLGVARDFYARILWRQKAHEKEREIWANQVLMTKWANVSFIALTAVGAYMSTKFSIVWMEVFTVLLGLVATGFAVYQLAFTPEREEVIHREAARVLLGLRDRALLLIQKLMISDVASHSQCASDLERLAHDLSLINQFAPATSARAYELASSGIIRNN